MLLQRTFREGVQQVESGHPIIYHHPQSVAMSRRAVLEGAHRLTITNPNVYPYPLDPFPAFPSVCARHAAMARTHKRPPLPYCDSWRRNNLFIFE